MLRHVEHWHPSLQLATEDTPAYSPFQQEHVDGLPTYLNTLYYISEDQVMR
jgi:hypothetical protein